MGYEKWVIKSIEHDWWLRVHYDVTAISNRDTRETAICRMFTIMPMMRNKGLVVHVKASFLKGDIMNNEE